MTPVEVKVEKTQIMLQRNEIYHHQTNLADLIWLRVKFEGFFLTKISNIKITLEITL